MNNLKPHEVDLIIRALLTHRDAVKEQFKYWRKLEVIQNKVFAATGRHLEELDATKALIKKLTK